LNAISYMNVEFSEDDEYQYHADLQPASIRELNSETQIITNEFGAARTRKAKKTRKTTGTHILATEIKKPNKSVVSNQVPAGTSIASGVKSRRRLRDNTPDVDIDVE